MIKLLVQDRNKTGSKRSKDQLIGESELITIDWTE